MGTVYRKEIYEGVVTTTDPKVLQRLGLNNENHCQFQHEDSQKYTRYMIWLTDAQCKEKKIQLRAPQEGTDVSGLVHPPIGFEEEQLQEFLKKNKVDVSKFGKDGVKSLAEFSEELVKGEAALMVYRKEIIRVVDVLILKLQRANGDIVVEVAETANGTTKETKRLPAVKRRTDENPFWAAHRVLNRVLKIEENIVTLDPNNMLVLEERTTSTAYGGLPTLYRKRIISAKLL